MLDFQSRKKHGRSKLTRNYRTTALIDVSAMPPQSRQRIADELDKAVYEATAKYPTVTHYLVKLVESNIIVGLQIEKVKPQNVQNIAAVLIEDSLESTKRSLELPSSVEIEESDLYLV